MAGSLNVPPESKAVGYCCFIVVMPAEGTVSAGLSLLHSWGSLIVSAVPPNRSPDKRGGVGKGVGGYWGEVNLASSLHWQGNESASHGFEFGRACSGTVSQRGNGLCRRASRSLADLTPRSAGASPSPGGQTRGLPRALTERDWSRLFLYYFYLFRLLVFHSPSLIFTHCLYFMYNSLWCLKLLFIPLSEMYNFVSHFE